MRFLWHLATLCSLAACTRTSVIPIATDTIEITASAAPVCGAAGAQEAAIRYAAVQVIKSGYDRFIVVGQNASNTIGVIGYTPLTANTVGTATASGGNGYATANGNAITTYSGGQPIIGGEHGHTLVVRMFREGDAGGANAVSARGFLGSDWQKAVSEGRLGTCL
jgi:hypothetical protein